MSILSDTEATRAAATNLSQQPPGLRDFIGLLEERTPSQVLRIGQPINPAAYEATALLQRLEDAGKYPLVLFERPLNLLGQESRFPLVTNVFATRGRCAQGLGLGPEDWKLAVSLEYARREARLIPPVGISPSEAPARDVVQSGDKVDLRTLPIVRHHAMDPAPYIDMACVMKDPDMGHYNAAFLRTMFKGPDTLGLYMSPRHNWQIVRKNADRKLPTPVAIVVSHHPGFFLGALNVSPFGVDDYEVIGSIMDRPLRLTPSETWGEELMVPADADIIIEGEVSPTEWDAEGPFGEFPGYYGPQRWARIIKVTALTHRKDAIHTDIFVGHRDNWVLGTIPKEGSLFNRIKGVVPTVKAVHLPPSGCGRYTCYISIDKKVEGESKQAALIALGNIDFIKHVVVVDADIVPFNEGEVMWAVATRVQGDQDVDIIKNVKGNPLDPSQTHDIMTTKMIIDATKPLSRPFQERLQVPRDALDRVRLEDFVAKEVLESLAPPD